MPDITIHDGTEPPRRPRQPMTPTYIAGQLEDSILGLWRRPHVTRDAGQLTGAWVGGPASPIEKAEWLAQIACEALEALHPSGAWQVYLDTDLDDQPTFLLVADRREVVEIPFRMSSRALRIGTQAIPLEAPDAGRRILELTCEALGNRFGVERRKGRRHDS